MPILKLLGRRRGTADIPVPDRFVTLPDLDLPPVISSSKKSGSDKFERFDSSAGSGGLEAGETRGEVCIASGILLLVSNTKNASPPSPSFMA